MADIASLNLQVNSDSIKQASIDLHAMVPAASAAERAAQKWGVTTTAAARSGEEFSKRVRGTIRSLEFERQQLTRNAAEQQRYAALRRAGVAASSAEGQAISASVAALQAQRAALGSTSVATKAFGAVWGQVRSLLLTISLATAVASIVQMGRAAFSSASGLEELGEQLGVSAGLLQGMQYQAVQSGVKLEQLETGISKFSQKMGEAADGSKDMIEALAKLGVNNLDLHGKLRPTEDLLADVAKAIMAIDDPARRSAAAVDFFGKAGARMLPLLGEIAKGSDSMAASAERAGALISEDTIKRLDKLADRIERSKLEWRAFFAVNIADSIEWLDKLGDSFSQAADATNRWLKEKASTIGTWFTTLVDSIEVEGSRGAAMFIEAFAALPDQFGKLFVDAWNRAKIASANGLNSLTAWLADKAPAWMGISGTNVQAPITPGGGASTGDFGQRVTAAGQAAANQTLAAQQVTRDAAAQRAANDRQVGMSADEDRARLGRLGPSGTVGVSRSAVKESGSKSDPYKSAIESGREYILTKKAETEALGQTGLAAARLKHEQELLNKVQTEGKVVSADQAIALRSLAADMAAADAALATGKFMDDFKKKSEEFILQQQIERDTLYMSAEAAMAYRLAQEAINQAKRDGLELGSPLIAQINELAAAQAAAAEKTRVAKEWADLEKEAFKGFFTDLNRGLREGKEVWESFGNAATNALNKIADKLMDMAINQLWDAAFPKGSGGIGGGLMGLLGLGGMGGGLMGLLGFGGGGGVLAGIGSGTLWAKGGAFQQGNVIPFARGGVVSSPTLFPMAKGAGLMGEAGPEAIMPLKRGRDGRLGVAAGSSSDGQALNVTITLDNELLRAIITDQSGKVVARATPRIVKAAIDIARDEVVPTVNRYESERQGDYRAG